MPFKTIGFFRSDFVPCLAKMILSLDLTSITVEIHLLNLKFVPDSQYVNALVHRGSGTRILYIKLIIREICI